MTIARGPAQLYDVGSFSVPKGGGAPPVYRVVLPYDKSVPATCTCPAFFYKSGGRFEADGECKHIGEARYQDSLAQDGPSFPTLADVAEDKRGDLVKLLEDAFNSGMRLGRKVGR